jgi:AraC-like DNA-binding protein
LAQLGADVPPRLRVAFEFCLHNATRDLTVADLADAVCWPCRTLDARFTREHVPPPSRVVGWCRLLVCARLLEDSGRSVESIAFETGFSSGGALSAMFRRFIGLRCREVRKNGGSAFILRAFIDDLHRYGAPAGAAVGTPDRDTLRPHEDETVSHNPSPHDFAASR